MSFPQWVPVIVYNPITFELRKLRHGFKFGCELAKGLFAEEFEH